MATLAIRKIIIFLLLNVGQIGWAALLDTSAAESCSILHRQGESSNITVKNNQYISNVEETYQSVTDQKWKPVTSFSIKPGCSLAACNATDFDGLCKIFETDMRALPEGFDDFRSTSCSCAKDCSCSESYIRGSGCARAYINKGCNHCHAYYMDLKGNKDSVREELRNNISSVMVRPGCVLTIYDDEDYEGDLTTLEGITKEVQSSEFRIPNISRDWVDGALASYQCSCDKSQFQPKVPKPRPVDYPESIAIPSTLDEISQLTNTYNRHPGLMASLKSFKNKRSPRNAYILLLGLTGAGKSSAINLLFDNPNVTKVADGISTTTDIHEFRIPVPVDELGITNSELRVIDTPGLGDTRGLEQDARFLATLDDYLSSHEELSHRLPNIVLMFGKFHDNRYSGKGSPFVKMLSAMDLFHDRITDKKYSNVIFVLSHFMSLTRDVTRRPTSKIRSFKKVIEEYSLFPKPISIVVAENKAEEQDLPMLNGYFKLPNGNFYPKNLFDKIQQILTNSDDPIGEAIIRTAFRDSDDFNITARHFKLVEKEHGKATKYLGILSGAAFPIENTEVSQILAAVYAKMNAELQRSYPDSLPYLQRVFNIRNIRQKTDIPKTTLEIVRLLKDIKQNDAITYLMDAAFQLRAPVLKENPITGYSYNVLEDRPLAISPFKLGELKISDSGYMFPNVMTCEMQQATLAILKTFNTREEYVASRLRSLSVDGTIPVQHFTGTVVAGSNLISPSPVANGTTLTLSALREHRAFELTLNDLLELTPEFIKTLKALPAYNESDLNGIETWKAFFNTYGTHVVKSTHGGGSIEIQLSTQDGQLGPDIATGMFDLIQFAEDVSTGHMHGGRNSNSTNQTFSTTGTPHVLKFKGGDFKYHATDLTSMTLSAAAELLENWRESVSLSPAILVSDMKLMPISQVAKKVGQNISSEIQRAALALFNATLKYIPPSQRPVEVEPDRQHTTQLGGSDGRSNDFTEFFKLMTVNQQKADERFQEMLLKMQIEAQAAEKRRSEVAEAQRAWENRQAETREQYIRDTAEQNRIRGLEAENRQREFEIEQQNLRDERDAREREWKMQQLKASHEAAERNALLMKQIAENSRPRGGGSCLKEGTRILMASGQEKPIETITFGDWIMDGNLNPTQVIGISKEFLMDQDFYGFIDGSSFFTDTHLFVAENLELYAAIPKLLYYNNPLMEYLSVQEMNRGFAVKRFTQSGDGNLVVLANYSKVFKDPIKSPQDTLVYFLQVDNLSGTYFANGYMARHEIPPFHIWPKTMATLFTLIEQSEILEPTSNLQYTVENVRKINELLAKLDLTVRKVFGEDCQKSSTVPFAENWNSVNSIKDLEDIDTDALIFQIFNNPALSAFAVGIYGKSGTFIAENVDFGDNCNDVSRVQVRILEAMSDVIKHHSYY